VFFQANNSTSWPGTDIIVHSVDGANGNPGNGEATLVWTAPVAGTIDVSGYLYYAFSPSTIRSNDFTLSLNSSVLQTGTLGPAQAGPSNEVTVSFTNLSVTAGEQLSLVFQRTPGVTFGSADGFDLTVTETATTPGPVPGVGIASLALLVIAGAATRARGFLAK
jgi:hypothetical protein